jgi:hypothetical protein
MSRRTTGVIFICLAAFLFGVRYLSAAIFASNVNSWSSDLFNAMLDYVGPAPTTLSIIALVVGIIYLLWAEIEANIESLKRTREQIRQNRNVPREPFFIREEEESKPN